MRWVICTFEKQTIPTLRYLLNVCRQWKMQGLRERYGYREGKYIS